MLNELESDINKLIDKWIKEKTEGYRFRDDDTYDTVMAIVDELQLDIADLIFDANCAIDGELENAEIKNGYAPKTFEDADDFVYRYQL